MFVKITIKSMEFNVKEFLSTNSLYNYLLDFVFFNLSSNENNEFEMTDVKSVSINGFELRVSELYFDSLGYLYGGVKLKHGIQTIFEKRIDDIVSLEIEV